MSEISKQPSMSGAQDLVQGLRNWSLWGMLAWWDIRSRYRRSVIGPFWLILSMAALIGSLTMVYAWIFRIELETYLPYLTIGFIVWGYMSTLMIDSCRAFIESQHLIRQANIPLTVLVMRVVARNVMVFFHTVVVFFIVIAFFPHGFSWQALYALPGLVALFVSGIWVCMLIAMLSARYRDFPQALTNAIQMVFFVTPIIWIVPADRMPTFVMLNPFYHYLEVIRAPVLGHGIPLVSWAVVMGLLVVGFAVTFYAFSLKRGKIIFWL